MNIKVDYCFYKEYIKLDSNFEVKMKKRIKDIRDNVSYKDSEKLDDDCLIREYFVEVFSWTALSYNTLTTIYKIIKEYATTLLDPCCGNSFHTYLFETFTDMKCISYDIQDEPNSWTMITVNDGLESFNELSSHSNTCLMMSWIDYDELSVKLLETYKGNIVLCIGNYYETNPNFECVKKLAREYTSIFRTRLLMPWNLLETIEIYVRSI